MEWSCCAGKNFCVAERRQVWAERAPACLGSWAEASLPCVEVHQRTFSTATCGSAICSDDLRWASVELVYFHFCIPNGSMSIPSYQVRFKAILLTKSQQSCLVLLCVTTWLSPFSPHTAGMPDSSSVQKLSRRVGFLRKGRWLRIFPFDYLCKFLSAFQTYNSAETKEKPRWWQTSQSERLLILCRAQSFWFCACRVTIF